LLPAGKWGRGDHHPFRADAQLVPNAAFDLLFSDYDGENLEVEVKGYMTRRLAEGTLQRSQVTRATLSAASQASRGLAVRAAGDWVASGRRARCAQRRKWRISSPQEDSPFGADPAHRKRSTYA
jgi:hypothetical protein